MKRIPVDDRRIVFIASNPQEAYEFAAQTFIEEAKKSIAARASFSAVLSGGSTPLQLYELLQQPSIALSVNWSLLDLFWGDERSVPMDHSDSNYGQAAPYFAHLPLYQAKRHRIVADGIDLHTSAQDYENNMKKVCPSGYFDTIFLGIGEDGHTASLFPDTKALTEEQRLYVANHIPQKDNWRITITFPGIDRARALYVLALGKGKAKALKQIFFGTPDIKNCPAQRLGTPATPACYIIDKKAAQGLGLS